MLYEVPFGLAGKVEIPMGRELSDSVFIDKLKSPFKEKYYQALTARDAGRTDEALKIWKEISESNKRCMPVYVQAIFTLIKRFPSNLQDTSQVFVWSQKAMAEDPNYPWLWYALGVYQDARGNGEKARRNYEAALLRAPQFVFPQIALGKLDIQREEFTLAKRHFRKAISLIENEPKASADERDGSGVFFPKVPYDELAYAFYAEGQEDSAEAVIIFSEGKEIKTARLQLVKALLLEGEGNLLGARKIYNLLLRKNPEDTNVQVAKRTLGLKASTRLHKQSKMVSSKEEALFAISVLEPLAHKYPRQATLWMALGQAYARRGLLGIAHESLDSGYKYDSTIEGLKELRQVIMADWLHEAKSLGEKVEQVVQQDSLKIKEIKSAQQNKDEEQYQLPDLALLGTYTAAWGSPREEVMRAYPRKKFRQLPNGNLLDVFEYEGVKHEYLLGFRENRLWGVRVFVTDSTGHSGDVFGHMIRLKAKISGEGKGTGEANCTGYRSFQGAVWETDDTFEFMAQFSNKETQVRMVRMRREALPENHRLCDMVHFLDADFWK